MTNPVRILIVENNEKAAGELRSRLERLGYLVLGVAGSGEEAVDRTRELNPDLLLMNIKLKDVRDGIHTGRLIHVDHKKPIIYITSSASQETIQRAGSAGSFGYLFPAMDDRQLYATIETAVSRNTLEIKLESSRHWLNRILQEALTNVARYANVKAVDPPAWGDAGTGGAGWGIPFGILDPKSGNADHRRPAHWRGTARKKEKCPLK